MNVPGADKDAQRLREAREYSERFTASLPQHINAATLTVKSKLPFKALSIRELLLHRMAALSTAAVDLFSHKRVIPAVILTRAVVETLAGC